MHITSLCKVNIILALATGMLVTTARAHASEMADTLLTEANNEASSQKLKKGIHYSALANGQDALLQMPMSIHPDFACLKLTQDSGIWKNMVGQTFGFIKAQTGQLTLSTTISGFIELHDISGQFMSWQMWRGNLGAGLYMEHQALNDVLPWNSRLILQTGWNHESQHVTDSKSFIETYTNLPHPDSFDNATARSFEYITVQLHYLLKSGNERWRFIVRPGYRYYPLPIVGVVGRHQRHSLSMEAGIHVKVRKLWEVYVHGLYERIENNYVSDGSLYKLHWNKEPLLYRQIEAGLSFNYNRKQCDIFMRYSHSNGRGLDYLRVMECAGGGFRFVL